MPEYKKQQESLPLSAPPSYLRSIVWLVPQAKRKSLLANKDTIHKQNPQKCYRTEQCIVAAKLVPVVPWPFHCELHRESLLDVSLELKINVKKKEQWVFEESRVLISHLEGMVIKELFCLFVCFFQIHFHRQKCQCSN